MGRTYNTQPGMGNPNISPRAIGSGASAGGAQGRDNVLNSGSAPTPARDQTTKAANWDLGQGGLADTQPSDVDGFSGPKPEHGESGRDGDGPRATSRPVRNK